MEKKKKLIKIKTRKLTIIFIIIITMLLFLSGYSLGKAYQAINIETNGKIAEPILVVENNPAIEIDGKKEKEYYNFIVKNSKENGETTQIKLKYYIEILTKTEKAISFKLYKNGLEIPLQNNKTQYMEMKKGELQEDKYKLEIIYDKTKNSSVEDIIQDVQIKVHSEQVEM